MERGPDHHWALCIGIGAKDALVRVRHAQGRRLSGVMMTRPSFIDSNSLRECNINAYIRQGEDQDMWPVPDGSVAPRCPLHG